MIDLGNLGDNSFDAILIKQIEEVQKLITEINQIRRAYTNVIAEIKSIRNDVNNFKDYFEKELEIIKTKVSTDSIHDS